jgi:hypothetical protein
VGGKVMKDMTVEELIKYICDDCIAVDSPEFPDELLRRFEDLKCCGNCGGGYTTSEVIRTLSPESINRFWTPCKGERIDRKLAH